MTPSDIDILQNMDSRMKPSDNSTAMQVWRKQYPGDRPAMNILFALLQAAMWPKYRLFKC